MEREPKSGIEALSLMAELGIGHVGYSDYRSNLERRWNGERVEMELSDADLELAGTMQAIASAGMFDA